MGMGMKNTIIIAAAIMLKSSAVADKVSELSYLSH
jgi:hypothetical protein